MQRLLACLAVVAVALLTIALLMGAVSLSDVQALAKGSGRPGDGVEPMSFGLGFGAGLIAVWVSKVPWADIPRQVLATILGWRRNAVLACLAAVAACVLLLY